MAWNLFSGLNPLGLGVAQAAAQGGFHNPGDQMFLGIMAQAGQQSSHPALTQEITRMVGIDGFNGTRMTVRKDLLKKHQRNIRDGKVTRGYHQTSADAALAILSSQQFHAGSKGCVGAGMCVPVLPLLHICNIPRRYFAKVPDETHPKTADHRGVVLVADLRLGHRHKVDREDRANLGHHQSCEVSLNFLLGKNCNSVKVERASGPEYVVYDPAQVSNIRVHSFCPGGGCIVLDSGSNEIILVRERSGQFSDFGGSNGYDRDLRRFQDTDRWQTCVRKTSEESLGLLRVSQPPFERGGDVVVHAPEFGPPIDLESGYKCYLVQAPSSALREFCTRFQERATQRGGLAHVTQDDRPLHVEARECVRFPVANVVNAARRHWRRGVRPLLVSSSNERHELRDRCQQILIEMVSRGILR